jgi:hypothetical protein
MRHFAYHLELCAPLFLLVFLGWALIKIRLFDSTVSKALSKLVFKFLMPMLLFRQMSHLSEMPPVDPRVLVAFFGSCIVVFVLGRAMGRRVFHQDSTAQVITGMGGIFGNNVQLGIPIVALALGQNAMPTISVLIIFNVLLLWTTATACVEFGRTGGNIDWGKFLTAMKGIFRNPIVLGILIGSAWGLTGLQLPTVAAKTLEHVTSATTPMALLVVGMGLAQHSFTAALPKGFAVSVMKLFVQPLLVYALCRLIGLGEMETQATTLLSSLPVAINLYIMSVEFEAEEALASNAIFVSTLISAVTVPLTMTLLAV